MADLDSFGLTQLAGGGGPYRVNIIFVHGLRGHLRHTWEGDRKRDEETSAPTLNTLADAAEYPQPKVFWPSEYLKHDIPDARVWTYEYDADTIGGFFQAGNENSIFRRGEDLAMQVSDNIRNEDPILFVAHSLGGLIVKKAICSSEPCRKRTKFIIFLGTPHRGSQYAGWPEIAANLARLALEDSDKDPEVDSEAMDSINEEFKRVVEESGIRICSFQETRGILGMKGPHDKVVDDFSSKLDLPEALETVKSIDADHRQMARCNDRSDPQHAAIASALMQFLRDEVNDGSETKSQESLVAASSEVLVEEESIVGGTTIDHVPPPCYYLPFPENQGFVGRDAILHDLQELLVDDHFNRVAVVGPEGVGKTQVALQLAYWAKKSCPQYSIFWVSARSYAAVVQTYMNIAKKIGIRSADDEDIVEAVRSYLSTEKAGPWLLILDDADNKHISGRSYDSRILHNYLPRSKLGLIVVTTDSNDVAYTIGHGNVIHLDPMDEQEARRLMGEIINKELLPDDDTTTRLLYECRYMPLAITLAASYLYKTHISIKEYLEHLREHWEHLRHEERQEPSGNNRLSQLLNPPLLNIIIDIDHISKSDNAVAELLAFISHIDAKGIPQSLLPKTHSEERLLQAIETLCAYGLLTKREDSAFYDIHNLVQMATRVWTMKHGLVKESTEKAIRHLARLFPSDESKNRNLWREYMPHALRVLEESTYYLEVIYRYDVEERYGYDLEERYKSDLKRYGSDLEDSYELFFRTGQCLQADGRTREAMLHLEACCHWRKAHFAEEHPDRLVSEHALAVAYQANGQVEKATELFNHVEAIRKTLEEEHPDRLGSQHGPGVAQSFSGSVEEVEDSDLELQDNALEDTGQETPSVLSSLWLWLMHIFFPPPTGYQRIPYTCGCGSTQYVDVKEHIPGGLRRFRKALRDAAVRARPQSQSSSESNPTPPPQAHITSSGQAVSGSVQPSSRAPARRQSSLDITEGSNNPNSSSTISTSSPPTPEYLLLCVNTKKLTVLRHVEVTSLSNDQYFFQRMLEEYQTARREHEWRFGMLIPSRIGKVLHETRTRLGLPEMPSLPSFVSKLISVHIHKIDVGHIVEFELVPIKMDTFPTQFKRGKVPTQDEVCNAGFLYNADVIVDQIPLYHLCTPGDQNHLDKFWLTRIPRKLRTELVRPAGHTQRVVGWGIHVNEGLNWVPILASLLFLLILFGLVVVLYAMATSDNSSAFGLGAYLVAVLTLYMTFQYFSWKEA